MFKYIKKMFALMVIVAQVLWSLNGYANPVGENVISGAGAFDRTVANQLTVTQSTDKLITQWQDFSIAAHEITQFVQPSSSSVALNRVVGGNPSNIFGTLSANGKIFLVNQNGILFAPGSHINVGGLIASTLPLSDANFFSGNVFEGSGGSVINQGAININAPGGYAALIGSSVENSGTIIAPSGTVVLASGNKVAVNLDSKGSISAVVINEELDTNTSANINAVKNSGTLTATDGKVILTAQSLKGIFTNLINNEGIIEANAITIKGNDHVTLSNTLHAGSGGINITGGQVDIQNASITSIAANEQSTTVNINYDGGLVVTDSEILSTTNQTGGSGSSASVRINGAGVAHITNSQVKAIVNSTVINPTLITGGGQLNINSSLNAAGQSGVILDNSQLEATVNGATTFVDNSITAQTNASSAINPNGPGDIKFLNGTTIKTHQDGIPGQFGFERLTISGKSITGDATITSTDGLTLSAIGDIGTIDSPLKLDVLTVDGMSSGEGDIYLQALHNIEVGRLSRYTNNGIPNYSITSLSANNGIVSLRADGDIMVNSIITPRGGVALVSDHGSIYAGVAGNHAVNGPNAPEHVLTTPSHLQGADYFIPTATGTGIPPQGPNVIASGYSYFSAPEGTIGVGTPTSKPSGVGAQIVGIVRPGITSVTGVSPAPAINVGNSTPSGGIYYEDSNIFGNSQIAPAATNTGNHEIGGIGGSLASMDHPLGVFIEVSSGSKSALPPGITQLAGLSIGITPPVVPVSPTSTGVVDSALLNAVTQLVNPLIKAPAVYFESLSAHLVRSVQSATANNFYAYHSLSPSDTSAFDSIQLDEDAYDYIDGRLNLNSSLNPYFQEEDNK